MLLSVIFIWIHVYILGVGRLITFKAKEPINIKYLFSMGAHTSSELCNSTSERLTSNGVQSYAKTPISWYFSFLVKEILRQRTGGAWWLKEIPHNYPVQSWTGKPSPSAPGKLLKPPIHVMNLLFLLFWFSFPDGFLPSLINSLRPPVWGWVFFDNSFLSLLFLSFLC